MNLSLNGHTFRARCHGQTLVAGPVSEPNVCEAAFLFAFNKVQHKPGAGKPVPRSTGFEPGDQGEIPTVGVMVIVKITL